MIQGVEEISANLDGLRFSEFEVLHDRKIDVVNGRQQERITPDTRLSSVTRLNVTSIRIVCEISDYSSDDIPVFVKSARAYATQWTYRTADSLGTAWIENRTIARVVSVQVRIVPTAYGYPLAGFIRISSGDLKTAQEGSCETRTLREPGQLVNQRTDKPVAMIER